MSDAEQPHTSGAVPTDALPARERDGSSGSNEEHGSCRDEGEKCSAVSRWVGTDRGLRRAVLTGFGILLAVPSIASAHGGEPGSGAGMVSALLLIVGAAAIGAFFGLGAVFVGADRERSADHDPIGGLLGIVLVVIGLSFARTATHHSWLVAAACLSAGGFCVFALSRGSVHRSATAIDGRSLLVATTGVLGHRALEGFALGIGVLSGSSVGLIGAAIITGHSTLEAVGLGGYIARRNEAVAAVVVVAIQATFLLGAGLASLTSVGSPAGLDSVIAGVVGGVLLVIGVQETAAHLDGGGTVVDT